MKRLLSTVGGGAAACLASLIALFLFECLLWFLHERTGSDLGGLPIILPFIAGFLAIPPTLLGAVIGYRRGGD